MSKFSNRVAMWGNNSLFLFGQAVFQLSNICFVFLMSRYLSLDNFAVLTLFSNFFFVVGVPAGALSITTQKYIALHDKRNMPLTKQITHKLLSYTWYITAISLLTYLLLLWPLKHYFHLASFENLLSFAPILLLTYVNLFLKSFLLGKHQFAKVGKIMLVEGISKILTAVVVIVTSASLWWVISCFWISVLISTTYALYYTYKELKNLLEDTGHIDSLTIQETKELRYFFSNALITTFGLVLLISLDGISAKHLLSSDQAGLYGLLGLYTKGIAIGSGMLTSLYIPLIAREAKNNKWLGHIFRGLAAQIVFLSVFTLIAFVFPSLIGRLLAPTNILAFEQYLPIYSLSFSLLSLNIFLINTQIVLKKYSFVSLTIVAAFSLVMLLNIFGTDIKTILEILTVFSVSLSLAVFSLFALLYSNKTKQTWKAKKRTQQQTVLIFNWRDTAHVWAGGAEEYVQQLGEQWVEKGYEVIIFCGFDRQGVRDEIINGVQIIRRGGFVTVYIWAAVYYLLFLRKKVDIIIDCENGIPFFSPLYARKPIFLVIHHIHKEIFKENLPKVLSVIAQFMESTLMPIVYHGCRFITVSESTRKTAIKLGIAPFSTDVIHNGVDLSIYKPGLKSKTPLVLYMGRLKPYKRIEDFIQVIKILSEKSIAARFVIAGYGEHEKKLKAYAKAHGIYNNIIFLGRVSEEDKVQLFQQAWVVVNPSSMEGWSITTIEANACKTPVVAANVPGLRDSVRHHQTGFLVELGDYQTMAAVVFRLLTNKKLLKLISDNAYEWSQRFSWNKSSYKFIKYFEEVPDNSDAAITPALLGK